MLKPHIIILGAGFGGTYVGKALLSLVKADKIDVTIVNKTNYFLFTPLLHEVATGSLSPSSVAEPIREIFQNTGVVLCQGLVNSIDMANRRVHVKVGDNRHTLPYDYLVIATGAVTNFYNIPGAEQFALPLKDLSEALKIRSRIIDAFEHAVMMSDVEDRKKELSFVVVGGGPTGVETIAELAEFASGIISRYYKDILPEKAKISLIHTGPELLQMFPPELRKITAIRLQDLGVEIILNKTVTAIGPKGLTLADGSFVTASTVIWTAGVKPSVPEFEGEQPTLVGGRIVVDEYFHVKGNDRVFALGDVANYVTSVPMLAQAAVREASIVASNIAAAINDKKPQSFQFKSKGTMASLGKWFAVGQIFSINSSGKFTWWIWRTVYLSKFASWRKRFKIAYEWTIDLFCARDVTKL